MLWADSWGEGLEPSSYVIAADSAHAEVTREFAEGLIAEFHRAEADARVALLLGRVQLAQGEHGLAVALGVERHRDVEPRGIVVHVGTVLDLDQPRRFDPQEHHAVLIARAVGCGIDEAPAPAGADVAFQILDLEAIRPEPLRDLLRIGPGLEHAFARRGDDAAQHDLAIERPGPAGISGHGRHLSFLPIEGFPLPRESVRGDRIVPPKLPVCDSASASPRPGAPRAKSTAAS